MVSLGRWSGGLTECSGWKPQRNPWCCGRTTKGSVNDDSVVVMIMMMMTTMTMMMTMMLMMVMMTMMVMMRMLMMMVTAADGGVDDGDNKIKIMTTEYDDYDNDDDDKWWQWCYYAELGSVARGEGSGGGITFEVVAELLGPPHLPRRYCRLTVVCLSGSAAMGSEEQLVCLSLHRDTRRPLSPTVRSVNLSSDQEECSLWQPILKMSGLVFPWNSITLIDFKSHTEWENINMKWNNLAWSLSGNGTDLPGLQTFSSNSFSSFPRQQTYPQMQQQVMKLSYRYVPHSG